MKTADANEGEESDFLWVGGHRCLDLVNTEMIVQGERQDTWRTPTDLIRWLGEAGLFAEAETAALTDRWCDYPGEGEAVLRAAREFRALARRMAEEVAQTAAVTGETLAAVNAGLRACPVIPQVAVEESGYSSQYETLKTSKTEDMIVARLAADAADLLCHADLSRVHRCENPRCILFFYDTSKNHARRWCSMSGCGNRAKATAHYQRLKQKAKPT